MKFCLLIFFLISVSIDVYSQSDNSSDTVSNSSDTLKIDPLDSLKSQSDINGIINYTATDSAVFDFKTDKLYLYNNAEVTYQDLKLNSGIIIIDSN